MKNSNLFWGGILVALGVLFILNNLDFLNFNWWSIFKLWPMLLILLGVTLLPLKNSIKLILTFVVLALTILMLFTNTSFTQGRSYRYNWDFSDRYDYDYERDYRSTDLQYYEKYSAEVEEATLAIEAIAGEFLIRGNTDKLFEFNQDGNIGPYVFSTNKKGNHQYLDLSLKNSQIRVRRLRNDVDIQLHKNPVWNIKLSSGAAKIDMDLSKYKIRDIDIEGGASSTYLKLGDRQQRVEVRIASAASSISIAIPEEAGCELTTHTVLSSKSFNGFIRLKKGLYQTENFDTAKNKIYIDIEAAVTSLKVRRY